MQNTFKRYEEKYLVSAEQAAEIRKIISQRMEADHFGEYLVQNLYFDTENWDIIRFSLEKPLYKEKMRLRCYNTPNKRSNVFLELKKKYKGIVYKRRIAFPYSELTFRSVHDVVAENTSQVAKELNFYIKTNTVFERIYIAYQRTAFSGTGCDGLRVTFDKDIRFRTDLLHSLSPDYENIILPQNKIVMEIKSSGAMPLWMSHALCENEVFPTSFSKYGVCYTNHILKQKGIKFELKKTEGEEKISA